MSETDESGPAVSAATAREKSPSRLSERFWLASAEALSQRLSEADRAALQRQLAIGRQRADAAETLWSNGHVADGLRLAVEAFETTLATLEPFARAISADANADPDADPDADSDADSDSDADADADPDADAPTHHPLLASRGFRPARLEALAALRSELAELVLPTWDGDIAPEQTELYQRLRAMQRDLSDAVAPSLMSPRAIRATRWVRVVGLSVLVIGGIVGAYLGLRTPPGVNATASGQWSADFGGPEGAIDGDPNTEWQSPNGEAGWLEITIEPPVHIERLRILNGHNRHYNDRAVRDATIEVYSDGELARAFDHTWPTLTPEPAWIEEPLGLDDVDRIRFVAHSFHNQGVALAEIQWE